MAAASDVYFVAVENDTSADERVRRLGLLIDKSGLSSMIAPGSTVCIKMHFGEAGNTGFVPPALVRVITDTVGTSGGSSVCTDTNTLYRGRRTNSNDHAALAREHGFDESATGARLYIPDDREPDVAMALSGAGRLAGTVHSFRFFSEVDLLIGLAHFKGHMVTGFGGALKNIGMGCATREGKLSQHCAVAPFVNEKNCIGCGACSDVCPADAVAITAGKAAIDPQRCIGCASCIAACGSNAVELDWGSGAGNMSEKMVEYAAAILKAAKKTFFISIAQHITAECDCIAGDDPRIIPDIGYCASTDPLALDQACYDLSCMAAGGHDPYRKAHRWRNPVAQLDHAEQLGIGSRAYSLVKVAV